MSDERCTDWEEHSSVFVVVFVSSYLSTLRENGLHLGIGRSMHSHTVQGTVSEDGEIARRSRKKPSS
jgi:hypothetical protein